MRRRARLLPLVFAFTVVCAVASADEIRLKDGSKIIGSIVGYEDDSFKVQTAYGFALVRKNSVKEIVPGDATKTAEGATTPADAAGANQGPKAADVAAPKPPAKSVAATAKSSLTPAPRPTHAASADQAVPSLEPTVLDASDSPVLSPASGENTLSSSPTPAPNSYSAKTFAALPPKPPSTASTAKPPVIPAPAVPTGAPAARIPTVTPAAAPAPPPPPPPLKEAVLGNLYTNQTYGFSVYRPPDWAIISDSRAAIPSAITALGTDDRSTLLVIGRDVEGGGIDARAASTERKLRDIYDNYRPQLSRHISVAGLPAVEQRFSGNADGHDWSVTAVTLARGDEVLTILGMTHADSDLIQFQEAVISKVIGSLQFIPAQ